MKRGLIANDLYVHVRSKPRHLLPLKQAHARVKSDSGLALRCFSSKT